MRRSMPFSNLPIMLKFLFMDLMLIAAVMLIWLAMLRSVKNTQGEKYREMEYNAVSASSNLLNLSVETSVSIAKSIYTNENIYNFLNTEYENQSEYYSVYYQLQQSTALNIADTNIIRQCIIYTSNPTVLTGGSIHKLDEAKDQYWYKYFVKTRKPTVICIAPDADEMVLVRKLDYHNLKTGESYICMYLEPSVLKDFADEYGFDGEFYIMCGGNLLYSSDKDIESADDIAITPDFECLKRNYYTCEIEFYSCAARKGLKDFLSANRSVMIFLFVVTFLAVLCGMTLGYNMKRRIRAAMNEYSSTGSTISLAEKKNGCDEIGRLLSVCGEMSGKIEAAGSEFKQHSDSLVRKSSEYDSLFATAMRLDAELAVTEKMPEILLNNTDEYIPITAEAELLEKTAEKYGAVYIGTTHGTDIEVPAYSIVLIAEDIFRNMGGDIVSVSYSDDMAEIVFEGEEAPRSTDFIKLSAIFENEPVSEDYSFSRDQRFNPYLRLKHCLGGNVEISMNGKNKLRLEITIKKEEGENDDS